MWSAMYPPSPDQTELEDWSFAEGLDAAFGDNPLFEDQGLVLPRARLDELITICELPGKSWKHAMSRLDRRRLDELLRVIRSDLEDLDLIDGDVDDVDVEDVPARYRIPDIEFETAEWPETAEQALGRWASDAPALRNYVEIESSMMGGEIGSLYRSDLDPLVRNLKAAGAQCRRSTRLIERLYRARYGLS